LCLNYIGNTRGFTTNTPAQAVSSGNILQSSFKFPFPIPFRSETSAFSCIFTAFCRFNAERLAFRRPKPPVFFAAVYSFRTDSFGPARPVDETAGPKLAQRSGFCKRPLRRAAKIG